MGYCEYGFGVHVRSSQYFVVSSYLISGTIQTSYIENTYKVDYIGTSYQTSRRLDPILLITALF